jgi:glucose-6-phosphate isomerase
MITNPESLGWKTLALHKKEIEGEKLASLFDADPNRFEAMSCHAAGITLDYSKNIVNATTIKLLEQLAQEHHLDARIKGMMSGSVVNNTEKRQALHTALRSHSGVINPYEDTVNEVLEKMRDFVEAVHDEKWKGYTGKPIANVVNIGIGGSDLGPLMVTQALKPFHREGIECHFVSNVDASDICETFKQLDPETTLFIVASKTFTTTETLANASTARKWLLEKLGDNESVQKHFVAVTANINNAVEFGINEDNIFPMWDWVGGRYSLWSAIGLPIALAIGMDGFNELRAGAAAMDQHFWTEPFERNMPVIMGLLGVWYINFWDAHSQAVLPYDHYLSAFTKYLQQLDMESNGKSASSRGGYVNYHVGPVIWGDVGTNGQHSFHQLLHQGTRFIPADFIIALNSHNPVDEHHSLLFANCLSQSRALMTGKTLVQAKEEFIAMGYSAAEAEALAPHKAMPGNRPSNTLVMESLTPSTLGALIALYEHKIYVQSVIWEINAFDQWGVELGKQLCRDIYNVLDSSMLNRSKASERFDASTDGLINLYQQTRNAKKTG